MAASVDWTKEEPMCWWTPADHELLKRGIVVTGPRKGWFGRWYMDYYVPPWANIYGEPFAWSERCAPPTNSR